MSNYSLFEVDFSDNFSMCIKAQSGYAWTIPEVSNFARDMVEKHGEITKITPTTEEEAKVFYDCSNINYWKILTKDDFNVDKKIKQKYEEYKLQWMTEHGYTLVDLLDELQILFDSSPEGSKYSLLKTFDNWEREGGFNHNIYLNYKTWLETIGLKGKKVPVSAIEEAYFKGFLKVTPSDEDDLDSAPICRIGKRAFFFKDKGYRQYLKSTTLFYIFHDIHKALCKIEQADYQEFIYYYLYLEDKLGKIDNDDDE